MKRITLGVLAHVDSGKTTLAEGLLYASGGISKLGRVDHGNAFLDTDTIERDRGITIFSKQAVLRVGESEYTILDTPGHVDFSCEMERTLGVLDYAVLVVSATDVVQSHTETVWRLLSHYNIPTFIFVNKMDIPGVVREDIMKELKAKLSDRCVDFSDDDFFENLAMCDEDMLLEYMENEHISDEAIKSAVMMRHTYPCFFGSALKYEGVSEFLGAIERFSVMRDYPKEFGAKVFKISEDEAGRRLVHLKITGGSLMVKTPFLVGANVSKVNEIRIYSGTKYENRPEVSAGSICAVTGLSEYNTGDGLGFEPRAKKLTTEPVFSYAVKLPKDVEAHTALGIFKRLEAEETELSVVWNEYVQSIDVRLMGEVQLEVLTRILKDRFGLEVEFSKGSIVYKETIDGSVVGSGHYEPLKHYAEVHLRIDSAPPGSGVTFKTECSEDMLDRNWQRLILTHLAEKEHRGVLIGAPVTDVCITLLAGRAHAKHTEGGDFRQATYRALRQGLMQANSVLLEPWYEFSAEVPSDNIGRLMTDMSRAGAQLGVPSVRGEMSTLSGRVPISGVNGYNTEFISYTKGRGRLSLSFCGYAPCENSGEVIAGYNYNPEADIDNTPDSVFCSHGSGFSVKWNEVSDYMHIELKNPENKVHRQSSARSQGVLAGEEELLRIFEMTYGKIERKLAHDTVIRTHNEAKPYKPKKKVKTESYLLIDGYNILFAWDELKRLADDSIEDARNVLINRVANFQAIKRTNIILVFDAYRVKGNHREVENIHGITVVYTKEAETADAYIEKTSRELSKNYRVSVATSDAQVQMIIFGDGAVRITPSELLSDIERAEQEMRDFIKEYNRNN